jgi:hypothetical protein
MVFAACATTREPSFGSPDWYDRASPGVHEAWRLHKSHYALLELVDAYLLNPRHPARREDVRRILGEPECIGGSREECYPNLTVNDWLYYSNRRIQRDHYVFVRFNSDGFVDSVDFTSE